MKTQFSIAVDSDVYAWLKEQAARQRISMGTYINTHFAALLPPAAVRPDAPADKPKTRAKRKP